jgi:putative ABC transport system ATP-binding protein
MSNPLTDSFPSADSAGHRLTAGSVLLQTRHLALHIDGRRLWQDLDLTLHVGDRLGITGPSGSGKTLLLRTLAGLEPLQSGTLVFCERALVQWPMPAYRARVVYVPQRPALREGTVEAALRAPFAFRLRRAQAFPDAQARTLLQAVGRDVGFLRQRAERLSGGEAQIVAVLRALLVAPDVLLLDEPTASLDAGTVSAIEQLLAHWIDASPGHALVWTSHDGAQLGRVTSRLLSLQSAS